MRIYSLLAAAVTLSQHTLAFELFPRATNQSDAAANQSDASTGSVRVPRKFLATITDSSSDPMAPCSVSNPCAQGCCNHNGYCGFGPSYCSSANCTDTCDAQAECGPYAPQDQELCPLNVCCSQFGFCGTTEAFCGDGCQNGCDPVNRPSCGGSSATQRYMGYYESWSAQRPCDAFSPGDLDPSRYTHLYYSFALIDSGGKLTSMNDYDPQFWKEFTGLKSKNPSLKTIISVGGWDAGGKVFSDLSADSGKISTFVSSALSFMKQYGFDGIDLDWEYPVAPDRDGSPGDKENFVTLLEQLKSACGSAYTVTITIPSSYWYMRGFDIVNIEKHIDWFNFMSYDIHGVWDGDSPYTQRVINPHTNLTEISTGLDLLWRNNIDPSKVALGIGFYGRSFTLSDPSCNTPGCAFAGNGGGSGGANPGKCTQVSGTLSDFEIADIIATQNPTFTYNEEAAVNWITWDTNQWVSFDDNNTLAQKEHFASDLCLSGQFAWAVDLGGPGSGQLESSAGSSNSSNGSGNSSANGTASGDVYISPDIWNDPNPTIACYPPCTFILPPYPLSGQSTLSFPLYTTSLEVAWPTTTITTGNDGSKTTIATMARTVETTVLTIPANTQSSLDVWNWPVNDTIMTQTTYQATSSILPSPFVITDDPNPQSLSGVTHPAQTRTVTVPPSPYSDPYTTTTSGSNKPTTTSSTTVPPLIVFPRISWTRGPPQHTCTPGQIGCGHKCRIFCTGPCLINCGVSGGFQDPNDPGCPSSICPPDGPPPGSTTGGGGGDDPNNNDPEDEGDECDPDLSDEQGSCPNGGFPLYNPFTRKIDCDDSADGASSRVSSCQAYAMNNPDKMPDIIASAKDCSPSCSVPSRKRGVWAKLSGLISRAPDPNDPTCEANAPPAPPTPTYTCSGAMFPNICANARSAVENRFGPGNPMNNPNARANPATMTRQQRGGSPKIGAFWTNKINSASPEPDGTDASKEYPGWGLKGCNVEEYPFSSGNPTGFAVNRLVPETENRDHGSDLNKFYRQWDFDAGNKNIKGKDAQDTENLIVQNGQKWNRMYGRTFVIEFDGNVADSGTEWGLRNNALGNICADPYGVEFLLAGGPAGQALSWDPYFTTQPGRLRTYTRSIFNKKNGQFIRDAVSVVPPQYCTKPSPGRKILVGNKFEQFIYIGGKQVPVGEGQDADDPADLGVCEPRPQAVPKLKVRAQVSNTETASLARLDPAMAVYADPAMATHAVPRSAGRPRRAPALALRDSVFQDDIDSPAIANVSSLRSPPKHLITARQAASGSYLDSNVYAFLGCGNDDIDPCEWGADCSFSNLDSGIGPKYVDGDDGSNTGTPTTTAAPSTTRMTSTTRPAASTTESTSSNCKVCIGVVGTPVTCSFENGCTPTTPTSSPTPPPPPPPPPSTPPAPMQTSSNNKGSGLCKSLGDASAKDYDGQNMCQVAYNRHLDDHLYTEYTSYTYTADDAFNTALDVFFRGLKGLVGQEGCTAYFKCSSDDAYKKGMTGKQIKDAFDNLYQNDKVKVCGSSNLDNGCRVTVNGCNNCQDVNVVCSTKAGNCSPDEADGAPSDNDSS